MRPGTPGHDRVGLDDGLHFLCSALEVLLLPLPDGHLEGGIGARVEAVHALDCSVGARGVLEANEATLLLLVHSEREDGAVMVEVPVQGVRTPSLRNVAYSEVRPWRPLEACRVIPRQLANGGVELRQSWNALLLPSLQSHLEDLALAGLKLVHAPDRLPGAFLVFEGHIAVPLGHGPLLPHDARGGGAPKVLEVPTKLHLIPSVGQPPHENVDVVGGFLGTAGADRPWRQRPTAHRGALPRPR
mmetsp:Transcript_49240/g.147077  ORF Transcript_49240/g.147077 Transcript_49240/m.147077 type:complete len:244 (+) Transcript_49240:1338-2069(+)